MRVLEISGVVPALFAARGIADMGADVIRVERPGGDTLAKDVGAVQG
jgi:alpha-methylacyl-CoA racemase